MKILKFCFISSILLSLNSCFSLDDLGGEDSNSSSIDNHAAIIQFTQSDSVIPDSIGIDVVLRDFNSNHPDFENFDSRRPTPTCGNAAVLDSNGDPQTYGRWKCDGADGVHDTLASQYDLPAIEIARGWTCDVNYSGQVNGRWTWHDQVHVTTGMAQSALGPNGEFLPSGVFTCDNMNQANWFVDRPPTSATDFFGNFSLRDVLWLKQKPEAAPGTYEINSGAEGYFPLDKFASGIDPATGLPAPNWGKQSYKLWCPPDEKGEWEDVNLCSGMIAGTIDVSNPLAHNYSFTMEGHTEFTYSGGEIFTFSGDDDMWIYVDGLLVVDLGGVHLPAWQVVDMDQLAVSNGWKKHSDHTLDFFYADRQTEGSDLVITTTLKGVKHTEFSDLELLSAYVYNDSVPYFSIVLNAELDKASLDAINQGLIPDVLVAKNENAEFMDLVVTKIEKGLNPTGLTGEEYKIYFDPSLAHPQEFDQISLNPSTSPSLLRSIIGRKVTSVKYLNRF